MRARLSALHPASPKSLLIPALTLAVGWTVGEQLTPGTVLGSSWYPVLGACLLAIGLYSSTMRIDLANLRRDWRLVVLAATLGVLAKAVLVTGAMLLILRQPWAVVLGVVVAQIDPLTVGANRARSRLSDRAKNILDAWASFDDPITALLTVYVVVFATTRLGADTAADEAFISPWSALLGSLGVVVVGALMAVAAGYAKAGRLWSPAASWSRRTSAIRHVVSSRVMRVAEGVCLLVLVALATAWSAFLGIALCGLFFRPRINDQLGRVPQIAFAVAAFAVGLLLSDSVASVRGLNVSLELAVVTLALAAFAAHALVSVPITHRRDLDRSDRIRLALAQQNGITAVVLALVLEPAFPGIVGIVALAVPVIVLLNAGSNAVWDRLDPDPSPPPPSSAVDTVAEHVPSSPCRSWPTRTSVPE